MVLKHRRYPLPSLNDFKVLTVEYCLFLMRGDNCFAIVGFISSSTFPLRVKDQRPVVSFSDSLMLSSLPRLSQLPLPAMG